MAWLESHGNLARHPKTRRLMQRMGWTLPTTIGNLHLLWYWALEYAPTGDLTKFEPDEFTHDLDLGEGTPEQFLEAMIHAGFIDRIGSDLAESRPGGTMIQSGFMDRVADENEDVVLRLHDWPEYTAKSLRPRFRRNPERWRQVLRSYGLPVTTYTRRTIRRPSPHELRSSAAGGVVGVATSEQTVPSRPTVTEEHAPNPPAPPSRDGYWATLVKKQREKERQAADRSIFDRVTPIESSSTKDTEEPENAATPTPEPSKVTAPPPAQTVTSDTSSRHGNVDEIPQMLIRLPGFVDTWWPKVLMLYAQKGRPLDRRQRQELLSRLCFRPNSAIRLIQHCVENFLECKWEHLANTS